MVRPSRIIPANGTPASVLGSSPVPPPAGGKVAVGCGSGVFVVARVALGTAVVRSCRYVSG
ncbi:hypothetical protein HC891_13650 [Candidatus Gracilibacteria bacterium]|nr:hypothetical protein [Candidatus Gracilibacteria bacterium]